jgi:hypothetical protein
MTKRVLFSYLTISILLLAGGASLFSGNYFAQNTIQPAWQLCGNGSNPGRYTSVQSAPSNLSPSSIEQTYQTFTIPVYWNFIEFRCAANSQGQTTTNEFFVYVGDGVTDYMDALSLTFQITAAGSSHPKSGMADWYYCNKVIAVETLFNGTAHYSAAGKIATYHFDRRWARKIAVVPRLLGHSCISE